MGDPKTYFIDLSDYTRPAPFQIPEAIYPDTQWFNAHRASNRRVHAVDGIEGLVVHVAPSGSMAQTLGGWKSDTQNQQATHWVVPDPAQSLHGHALLAVIYESLAARHMPGNLSHHQLHNRGDINHWTLSVALTGTGGLTEPYSRWQLEATALLARYCWAKYPNFRYIFSNSFVDAGHHAQPGSSFDWDDFCALVLSAANDPVPDQDLMGLWSETDNIISGNRAISSPGVG